MVTVTEAVEELIGWQQKDAVSALLREHIGDPFALRDYGGNWRVVGAAKTKQEV